MFEPSVVFILVGGPTYEFNVVAPFGSLEAAKKHVKAEVEHDVEARAQYLKGDWNVNDEGVQDGFDSLEEYLAYKLDDYRYSDDRWREINVNNPEDVLYQRLWEYGYSGNYCVREYAVIEPRDPMADLQKEVTIGIAKAIGVPKLAFDLSKEGQVKYATLYRSKFSRGTMFVGYYPDSDGKISTRGFKDSMEAQRFVVSLVKHYNDVVVAVYHDEEPCLEEYIASLRTEVKSWKTK